MRVVVVGTGTGVGKTTFSVALVRGVREAGHRVIGWKPVETGGDADGRALAAAAGAAEPVSGLRFQRPVTPSLAARLEGLEVDLDALVARADALERSTEILVVESAGGLFSPLRDDGLTNAELAVALRPDLLVLVAANRLGVLHDVEACRRALLAMGVRPDVVVLTGGDVRDQSVAWNADEVRRRSTVLEMPIEALEQSAIRALLAAARPADGGREG